MPMPFQYGYPFLEDSASDSFPCDHNTQSQDYIDISLAPNQVSHNSFSFHPLQRDMRPCKIMHSLVMTR